MKKKELIMSVLEKIGYSPEIDNDGDIMFPFEMKTIYVLTEDDDEPHISMIHPKVYEIEDGQETLALAVCNKMTRERRMVKVFIEEHSFKRVLANCDFFYANEDALESNIRHSLDVLSGACTIFRHGKAELSED